jgi:hypothetical protein
MKFGKNAVANPEPDASREGIREIAEALSLYRAAMHHIADREAAGHPIVQGFAARRPARTIGFRLLLAPVLAAAVAAGVFVPVYGHFHHHGSSAITAKTQPNPADNRAAVDDTALMNQIDSELSEDVPDALRPLADLSEQSTTSSSVSEKKNVTKE